MRFVAVMAQIADMERHQIKERCDAGRAAAKASLALTGKTHRGKVSLGRPVAYDREHVLAWRRKKIAGIANAATHFAISTATAKRYCTKP